MRAYSQDAGGPNYTHTYIYVHMHVHTPLHKEDLFHASPSSNN